MLDISVVEKRKKKKVREIDKRGERGKECVVHTCMSMDDSAVCKLHRQVCACSCIPLRLPPDYGRQRGRL